MCKNSWAKLLIISLLKLNLNNHINKNKYELHYKGLKHL